MTENALQLYMKGGPDFIDAAIKMVAKTKDKIIQETLMNYLTGSNGGPAQDPKYILDLYLQLGEIKKPVKIAIAIAEDDM